MKDILEFFTNQWKLSIMETNPKFVEMNENDLKVIAEDESKSENKLQLRPHAPVDSGTLPPKEDRRKPLSGSRSP